MIYQGNVISFLQTTSETEKPVFGRMFLSHTLELHKYELFFEILDYLQETHLLQNPDIKKVLDKALQRKEDVINHAVIINGGETSIQIPKKYLKNIKQSNIKLDGITPQNVLKFSNAITNLIFFRSLTFDEDILFPYIAFSEKLNIIGLTDELVFSMKDYDPTTVENAIKTIQFCHKHKAYDFISSAIAMLIEHDELAHAIQAIKDEEFFLRAALVASTPSICNKILEEVLPKIETHKIAEWSKSAPFQISQSSADLTFTINKLDYHVHRQILSFQTDYFAKVFQNDLMNLNDTQLVEIDVLAFINACYGIRAEANERTKTLPNLWMELCATCKLGTSPYLIQLIEQFTKLINTEKKIDTLYQLLEMTQTTPLSDPDKLYKFQYLILNKISLLFHRDKKTIKEDWPNSSINTMITEHFWQYYLFVVENMNLYRSKDERNKWIDSIWDGLQMFGSKTQETKLKIPFILLKMYDATNLFEKLSKCIPNPAELTLDIIQKVQNFELDHLKHFKSISVLKVRPSFLSKQFGIKTLDSNTLKKLNIESVQTI